MIQHPWRASSGAHTDVHGNGIEMQQSPPLPHRPSQISFASDGTMHTQKPGMAETVENRPFLPHKNTSSKIPPSISTLRSNITNCFSVDSTISTASVKAKSGRQLRSLLIGGSFRWILSLLLCAAWVLATRLVVREGPVTEIRKRVYNAVTTGIGLALGLNIASAFKDMALTMRWPILARRARNLTEVSLAQLLQS